VWQWKLFSISGCSNGFNEQLVYVFSRARRQIMFLLQAVTTLVAIFIICNPWVKLWGPRCIPKHQPNCENNLEVYI